MGEELLTEIRHEVHQFLAGREQLFAQRVAAGRIVDGHGDLICDDIFCLDDGPRILDCLEFDDRLRYVDGLDDIAFLAMDLEKLGAPRLAHLLLDRYADFAGDPAPASLRHHYIAYRAFVRVKVNCLRHAQGDRSAAADARAYADIAIRHLRAGSRPDDPHRRVARCRQIHLAGLVADRLGAVLLSTDRLRKEMSGLAPLTRSPQPYERGLYDHQHTGTYVFRAPGPRSSIARQRRIGGARRFLDQRPACVRKPLAPRSRSTLGSPRSNAGRHRSCAGPDCWPGAPECRMPTRSRRPHGPGRRSLAATDSADQHRRTRRRAAPGAQPHRCYPALSTGDQPGVNRPDPPRAAPRENSQRAQGRPPAGPAGSILNQVLPG